jgi:hypothetical protein
LCQNWGIHEKGIILGCLDQEKELAEADEAVLRAVVFQVNTYTSAKSQSMLVNLGQPFL